MIIVLLLFGGQIALAQAASAIDPCKPPLGKISDCPQNYFSNPVVPIDEAKNPVRDAIQKAKAASLEAAAAKKETAKIELLISSPAEFEKNIR